MCGGCAVAQWLKQYATSRGSRADTMNAFCSIYLILPAELLPGLYAASNRNGYQKQRNIASREQSATSA
jgi:hypothetical protein